MPAAGKPVRSDPSRATPTRGWCTPPAVLAEQLIAWGVLNADARRAVAAED